MDNDRLAEIYHNDLENRYISSLEKVDSDEYYELIDKYKKMQKRYKDLKAGYENFIENIKEYVRKDNMHDLAEFLVSEGICL